MAQTDLNFSFEIVSNNDDERRDNSSLPIQLDVLSFTLEEGLNRPFVLDVELVSFDSAIDFNAIIDKPALLTIYQGGVKVRLIQGLVSDFEQGKTGHRRTFYRARIEPSLARLSLTSDWRIFQQTPANDILSSVLKANRIDNFEINSQQEHVAREYLVQPGVLDSDFIDRLAAQE
ncbi:MAG: contractile injection system protein, VgrG/Pvc8 family, partial [Saezia sp.]